MIDIEIMVRVCTLELLVLFEQVLQDQGRNVLVELRNKLDVRILLCDYLASFR